MAEIKNVFDAQDVQDILARIDGLTVESQPVWGKMSVGQMLAHCCIPYEQALEDSHPKATGLKRLLLKTFLKPIVVNEKPYKKNSSTAPAFLITNERDFDQEKNRLTAYIRKTAELGASHFDGKESTSFGPLTEKEWNNLFYKHLDHHLRQFGV
jgi:hypothetical protein